MIRRCKSGIVASSGAAVRRSRVLPSCDELRLFSGTCSNTRRHTLLEDHHLGCETNNPLQGVRHDIHRVTHSGSSSKNIARAPSVFSLPSPPIACHLGPRQSRGPGKSREMVNALAHRLVGGLQYWATRPMATATRIAPGTTKSFFE